MTSAALLLAYGVAAGTWGAGWLSRTQWGERAPRLAIAAWQALAASVLLSLSAAGMALAIGFQHVRIDLAALLHSCAEGLLYGYRAPGGSIAAALGVGLLLTVATRTAWCTVRAAVGDRRERAARVAMLDLVGRTGVVPGVLVVDHGAPYAFCIGGRRHRVVVTSGLLASLAQHELDAVLAHEAAHLRQRHHFAMLICRSLFESLAPVFPAFRRAMPEVRLYAELCADDSARRRVGSRPLRNALATLACGPAPAGALAATGLAVETRLARLALPNRHLGTSGAAVVAFAIGAAFLIPFVLATAPVLTVAWEGLCLLA